MTRADKKAYIDDLASQAEVSGHSEGRTRTGVQDHQARQRQVPQSQEHTDCGQTGKVTHHGSREGGKMGRAFQRSAEQATTNN